jgi:hypothetical protein
MSTMEQPESADLLAIARETLLAEILPHLSGDARFKALMVANAMAIAGRAAQYEPVANLSGAAGIVAAIRAGTHDGDADLALSLLAHTQARCRVSSKPVSKTG